MRWPIGLLLVALATAACTQKLTTTADCPALCPGGQSAFRDTVLDAEIGLDSSYSGYVSTLDATSLLASNGGGYGEARSVVRFLRRGDSTLVRDTMRTFTVDSVVLQVTLQRRDTTVNGAVLSLYRLPATTDTLATFASIDGLMTEANKLGDIAIPNSVASGLLELRFVGADLAKLAFRPEDTTALSIGLKLSAPAPSAVRLGSLLSGAGSPLFTSYITVNIADTALRRQLIGRNPFLNLTVRPPAPAPGPDVLPIGGIPASRAFLRFTLPRFIRDSASIVRATLELTSAAPLFGIPADSTFLDALAVLADFGAKSPVSVNAFGSVALFPGMSSFNIEIVPIVRLWQGSTPLPSIVRLSIVGEGASFLAPQIRSTRALVGRPKLHLTYRLPFAFEGF